ncbi:hypothetical protein NPIL_676481, partial [Nephila pilipes]
WALAAKRQPFYLWKQTKMDPAFGLQHLLLTSHQVRLDIDPDRKRQREVRSIWPVR